MRRRAPVTLMSTHREQCRWRDAAQKIASCRMTVVVIAGFAAGGPFHGVPPMADGLAVARGSPKADSVGYPGTRVRTGLR